MTGGSGNGWSRFRPLDSAGRPAESRRDEGRAHAERGRRTQDSRGGGRGANRKPAGAGHSGKIPASTPALGLHFARYRITNTNLLLNDRITQAIALARRQNRPIAVIFLDLDRFKYINDSLGHAIGDNQAQKIVLANCDG